MAFDPSSKSADDETAEATAVAPSAGGDSPRIVHSEHLLGGASQLAILHNQSAYFLRQTRLGKLILTK